MNQWQQMATRAGGAWRCVCFCILLSMPFSVSGAEAVKLDIQGIDGPLKDNATSYIGPLTTEDLKSWRDTRSRLLTAVHEAMEAMGYYSPDVQVQQDKKGGVRVTVAPGQPVLVGRLTLVFEGEAGNDIAFTALRENMPLKESDVFHHGQYEKLKSGVQALALERGYFDAAWSRRDVIVDPVKHRVDIDLVYVSGRRFFFGPVSFVGPDGAEQHFVQRHVLETMIPFSEGDPFEAAGILKLNKSLLDSRYFSEVRVRHQREEAVDLAIPVRVTVADEEPNDVDVGIGYSTDVETRLSLTWRRPLINDSGHGIEASTELSQVRRSFDATYTIPWKHPIDDVVQLIYGVQRENLEDVITYSTVVGVQRQIEQDQGWKRTYMLRWNRESSERPDGEESKSDLLMPGFSLDRVRTRGGVDPHWGDRQYYQAEFASKQLLSDADFVSLRAGFRWLRTAADNHKFFVRLDGGSIVTSNFDEVPVSMRFFAGGDQSVRGYDYKSISPRDEQGIAVGGRNLATGSLEYNYTIYPKWRVALFTDAGNAFDSVNEPMKVGAGTGVRWVSPLGPIRLDFAWSVSEPEVDFRIHFFMGPSL